MRFDGLIFRGFRAANFERFVDRFVCQFLPFYRLDHRKGKAIAKGAARGAYNRNAVPCRRYRGIHRQPRSNF